MDFIFDSIRNVSTLIICYHRQHIHSRSLLIALEYGPRSNVNMQNEKTLGLRDFLFVENNNVYPICCHWRDIHNEMYMTLTMTFRIDQG